MTKIFLFLFSIFFFVSLQGQKLVDADLETIFSYTTHRIDYSKPLRNANNEGVMLISAAFLFYKTFISSQDQPSCVFSPSCSVYSIQAFQKKGLFKGWLYTFDRLTRCHSLVNPKHYVYDKQIQRYYDPVE
jgi:putative membrane protein insertion efficiency factor